MKKYREPSVDDIVKQTIAIRKLLNKKLPKNDKWAVSKSKVRKEVKAKIKENTKNQPIPNPRPVPIPNDEK